MLTGFSSSTHCHRRPFASKIRPTTRRPRDAIAKRVLDLCALGGSGRNARCGKLETVCSGEFAGSWSVLVGGGRRRGGAGHTATRRASGMACSGRCQRPHPLCSRPARAASRGRRSAGRPRLCSVASRSGVSHGLGGVRGAGVRGSDGGQQLASAGGASPLRVAFDFPDLEVAEATAATLLANGANPSVLEPEGDSALHAADLHRAGRRAGASAI